MKKLVVNHSYTLGFAWDKTVYRNHGILHYTTAGTGDFAGSLSFARGRTSPGSCVAIRPSKSLRNLGCIRVRVRLYQKGGPGLLAGDIHSTIVAGHESFSLETDGWGHLFFLGRPSHDNPWFSVMSPPRVIEENNWYDVEAWYDGISSGEIWVNGARVASEYDLSPGALPELGPHGVFVGHHPSPSDDATFNGYISHVQIYKRDEDDVLDYVDPRCRGDIERWFEIVERLKDSGVELKEIRALLSELESMGADLVAELRGGSEDDTQEMNKLMREFLIALRKRKSVPIEPSLEPLLLYIAERLTPSGVEQLREKAESFIGKLPFTEKEILAMGDDLCFTDFRKALEDFVEHSKKDPKWKAMSDAFRRRR